MDESAAIHYFDKKMLVMHLIAIRFKYLPHFRSVLFLVQAGKTYYLRIHIFGAKWSFVAPHQLNIYTNIEFDANTHYLWTI